MAHGVHNSNRATFLIEWILRRSNLFAGIVKIRQRDGRRKELATRIGVKEKGSEFIAEPEGTIRGLLHRFDVEIGAGENAFAGEMLRNCEGHVFIRISQFKESFDRNGTRSTIFGFEIRTN